ncbi:unnamed protein product [Hymenolepis diminuta]|uniref:EF-hand domain-containing family member C2 n=1 Tax=Hymenolepis diminuta TaxID=6216 RepID=A0A0R3SUV1_HYMDI|nr:unnamed protein product [Hymenolepis diminuta]
MALPFLPGYSFSPKLGKVDFRKSQYLDKKMGICHVYDNNVPGIEGNALPGQRIDPPMSTYPVDHGPKIPTWVAFDKKASYIIVLCFDAYIKPVNNDPAEHCGVSKCQVLFYLEDDTIKVIASKIINSGLPQGTIVRRHRIRKPPPNDDCFYTVDDFNVGIDLELYGRIYRLISCDKFTTDFLRKLGVRINEPEEMPLDRFSHLRINSSAEARSCQSTEHPFKLRQFLDHDRQVLRFYCFWDDTDSPYGDARDFVLYYFLADDTIEITEKIQPNSGRDALPCFLKRQKLPKGVPDLPLPGGGQSVVCLKSVCKPVEYYTDRDLTLGALLNVYGRKFLICDCDEFTKEYFRKKYNIETLDPISPLRAKQRCTAKQKNPPCNGRSSDEDSLANNKSLMSASSGRCDEWSSNQGKSESDILHFMARIIDRDGETEARKVILSCFPCDNTFMVYESPVPNSGFKGGKFMERCKVMKPGQSVARTEVPKYYSPSDVYIGAQLIIQGSAFEIYSADEHTLMFMENHPSEFHVADVSKILQKMKPLVCGREEEVRRMAKEAGSESLDFEGFKRFVKKLLSDKTEEPICIVLHEIVTLARHYSTNVSKEMDYEDVMGLIQQHLRKLSYEAFEDLLNSCYYEDYENKGTIKSTILRRIFKTNRLPISDDIVRTLLDIFQDSENEMIDYKKFINQMNWKCNPFSPGELACEYSGNLELDMAEFLQRKKSANLCQRRIQHIGFIEDLINA